MKFLCAQHRHHLLQHRHRALNQWEEWIEAGYQLSQQQNWQQALPYLGCAFEISDWLVDQPQWQQEDELTELDRFTISTQLLATCFSQLNEVQAEGVLLESIHAKLLDIAEQEFDGKIYQCLRVSQHLLDDYQRRHGDTARFHEFMQRGEQAFHRYLGVLH